MIQIEGIDTQEISRKEIWIGIAMLGVVFVVPMLLLLHMDDREDKRAAAFSAHQSAIDSARAEGYRIGYESGFQEGGRSAARTKCRALD